MSADDRKSMLPKKATCRCGHPDCPHPAPEVAYWSDKESRAVVDERNAVKPDTGSSEERQHENPCPEPPTCGIAGCDGKHHPQDHNAIFDTSTDDQSRSLFHSLQEAIRERNALQAELERVKAERNTIHDWYVDAKTENVRLRALIRKDTNDE